MKLYQISRDVDRKVHCLVKDGNKYYPLTHAEYHSPDGFETGYGGSGPADLSLSILADVFGDTNRKVHIFKGLVPGLAWDLHQDFKWECIARYPLLVGESYELLEERIKSWAAKKLLAKTG